MNFDEKIKTIYKEVTEISRGVVEKFEVGIEKKINYDAVETSSKNLKVSRESSTRSMSDSKRQVHILQWHYVGKQDMLVSVCKCLLVMTV